MDCRFSGENAKAAKSGALPGDSPGENAKAAKSGALPGDSPGENAKAAKSGALPGENPTQTDRHTDKQTEKRERIGAALPDHVSGSRLQWAVLTKRVKTLEGLGHSIAPEERRELRKARALLREVEKQQAAGNFEPVQTTQTPRPKGRDNQNDNEGITMNKHTNADEPDFGKKTRRKKRGAGNGTAGTNGTNDRLPPYSEDAEMAVIGCVLLEPAACLSTCEESGCAPSWFYLVKHQMIWAALRI